MKPWNLSPRLPCPRADRSITLLALTLFSLAMAGCGSDHEARSSEAREVTAVLAAATTRAIPLYVTATGGIEADKTIRVSTRIMGWIRSVHVTEGQYVTAGSPLLSIDDTDLRAKLARAEAGIAEAEAVLANAEITAARFERLFAEKAVSRQQLDDVLTQRTRAEAGVAAAQAGRDELLVHLVYVDIKAPVSGTVVSKQAEVGDMANPGTPLLVLEQNEQMTVVASLGEKDIGSVAVGDTVQVTVSSLTDATYTVALSRVNAAASPGSRTYEIEANLANDGRLRSGMFARVLVPVGRRDAIVVPEQSLVSRGQLRGVFVVDAENTAHLRWIRIGRSFDGEVEIISGLASEETVVLTAAIPLRDGDKVVK
ncbi:MAG: efflux RND transporter periplasmic adaptor subunit [bacterium]